MAQTVDAELVMKAAQEVLRANLNAYLKIVEAEWNAPQTLPYWTAPADPIDLGQINLTEINIGQLGEMLIVEAEQNFPAIWVWVNNEDPDNVAEQNVTGEIMTLIIRVVVQGVTLADTQKRLYRYTDAIRRTIMAKRGLLGACEDQNPPAVDFVSAPADPLVKGAQLSFPLYNHVAWSVS